MSTNTILATTPLVSTNYLLRATGTTIGNSLIFDNGTNVGIGTASPNASYRATISGPASGVLGGLAIVDTEGASYSIYSASNNLTIRDVTNAATRITLTSAGNVGIGTSTVNASSGYTMLRINGGSGSEFSLAQGGTDYAYMYANSSLFAIATQAAIPMVFQTNAIERMRITSGGWSKFSNTGSYLSATGNYHEFVTNETSQNILYIRNSSANPFGVDIKFNGASPNVAGNNFIYCSDTTTPRFVAYSNGGLANYSANNTNLSDERTKKEITPLESYWNKFKAIEIVKFKYKDQTHDDFNIGVIAQQVESVAPEFVDIDGFGKTPEDGIPLKTVYTSDLHHATIKVLQEAMTKIEELENRLIKLESK